MALCASKVLRIWGVELGEVPHRADLNAPDLCQASSVCQDLRQAARVLQKRLRGSLLSGNVLLSGQEMG